MAIAAGRAAAAAFRRIQRPGVGSQVPHFAKTHFRPSFRVSGQADEMLAKQIEGMSTSQATRAKELIDKKLAMAGVVPLTGDAAFRALRDEMREEMKYQRLVTAEHQKLLQQLLNKKGDITSVQVGRHGTLNLLGLLALLKIDDFSAVTPVVDGVIECIKRFF